MTSISFRVKDISPHWPKRSHALSSPLPLWPHLLLFSSSPRLLLHWSRCCRNPPGPFLPQDTCTTSPLPGMLSQHACDFRLHFLQAFFKVAFSARLYIDNALSSSPPPGNPYLLPHLKFSPQHFSSPSYYTFLSLVYLSPHMNVSFMGAGDSGAVPSREQALSICQVKEPCLGAVGLKDRV